MNEAAEKGATVMIWPEATLPGLFSSESPEARELAAFARRWHVQVIASGYDNDPGLGGYRNCSIFLRADEKDLYVEKYAKQHLVPFGEFVPLRKWFTFIDKAVQRFGMEDLAPGPGPVVFQTRAGVIAPLICYEGIFAALPRQAVGKGAQILAIQTFDTWYGDSAAPYQHVSLAVLRAVEEGRWIARAGATGISCFISPQGRILDPVALNTRGMAARTLECFEGRTLYQRCGDWFVAACLLLCLGLAWKAHAWGR
jgi:apolipoprotein N-acyltransferase